jgi:hypothetical protein
MAGCRHCGVIVFFVVFVFFFSEGEARGKRQEARGSTIRPNAWELELGLESELGESPNLQTVVKKPAQKETLEENFASTDRVVLPAETAFQRDQS